jgi:hypothetical protein
MLAQGLGVISHIFDARAALKGELIVRQAYREDAIHYAGDTLARFLAGRLPTYR